MEKASKRKKQGPLHTEVKAAVDPSEGKKRSSFIPYMNRKTVGSLLLIAVVCFAAYANSFSVPFIWDDINMISENPVIHNLDNFTSSLRGYQHNHQYQFALVVASRYDLVRGFHAVDEES